MVKVVGGTRLEKALDKIAAGFKKATSLEVGFIDGATYPDGTLVSAVAAYNEFGTENIPPRPFFRNMIRENSAKWPVNLATALKNNNNDTEKALGLVGQEIQEELQTSILSNIPPPDADATAKAKGFNRTLIDTGVMLNSVAARVDTGPFKYRKVGGVGSPKKKK